MTITRTTGTAVNTAAGGSGNANKNWADDNVRTDVHDAAHTVITTANAGDVVHDKVFVTRAAGAPAGVPNPTGTVTFNLYAALDLLRQRDRRDGAARRRRNRGVERDDRRGRPVVPGRLLG